MKEGEQRDSAERCFFFLNNPAIWSLMVSLEISSIKALFCLPKDFFHFWPHLPHRDSLPCIISSFQPIAEKRPVTG